MTCRTGDALVAVRAYSLYSVTCTATKPHNKEKEERGGVSAGLQDLMQHTHQVSPPDSKH